MRQQRDRCKEAALGCLVLVIVAIVAVVTVVLALTSASSERDQARNKRKRIQTATRPVQRSGSGVLDSGHCYHSRHGPGPDLGFK